MAWSDRLDAAYVERWAALRRDRDHAGHYNLVRDLEVKRLRAELDTRRATQPSQDCEDYQQLETKIQETARMMIPGI